MKTNVLLSSLLFASSLFMACADDTVSGETYAGTLTEESANSLTDVPLCDLETPCPDGLSCLWIDALDIESAVCIDGATACELLDCGDGECLILQSYPGQLMCSGGGGGSDDDCAVSSDGTTSCDNGDGDSDEPGSEPGSPGGE